MNDERKPAVAESDPTTDPQADTAKPQMDTADRQMDTADRQMDTAEPETDVDQAPASGTAEIARSGQPAAMERRQESSGDREPLMSSDAASQFRSRWEKIQVAFVDDPQSAVKDADGLVAEAMQHLAKTFASERANLEQQWSTGGEASTEDLRVALQRYRSFFGRLLSL
jgi:hypothetical protein